jgi:hypothetical protein
MIGAALTSEASVVACGRARKTIVTAGGTRLRGSEKRGEKD